MWSSSSKWQKKSAGSKWQDGISHQFWFKDLEMMSAACIPVVGCSQRKGSEFPEQVFFFFILISHSFGILKRPAEFFRLKLESETENLNISEFSMIVLQSFQVVKIACRSIMLHTTYARRGKNAFLVWLAFIFHKDCVTPAGSHTP